MLRANVPVSKPANGSVFGSMRMPLSPYLWEFLFQLARALSDNGETTQLLQLQEDSRIFQGMTPCLAILPVAGLIACWEM